MNTNQVVGLEERFYVGEHGFKFVVKTGLNMSALAEGEIKSVLKCPHNITIKRVIPLVDVVDAVTGTVLMEVGSGDLDAAGNYSAQIFILDSSLNQARPSHIFTFVVMDPVVKDFESIFA